MGGFANTVFSVLLGWLQTLAAMIWYALTNEKGSLLRWIGEHWIVLAAVLCAVGLIADLCVYLARWEPFRVWWSFFHRKEFRAVGSGATLPREQPGTYPDPAGTEPAAGPLFAANRAETPKADYRNYRNEPENAPEPVDDTGWEAPAPRYIPEDSPYRRPVPAAPAEPAETEEVSNTQRHMEQVMRPRRRRIRVSGLLGDPDEGQALYSPPRPVIDKNEAYHPPVYPRKWKDQESDTE